MTFEKRYAHKKGDRFYARFRGGTYAFRAREVCLEPILSGKGWVVHTKSGLVFCLNSGLLLEWGTNAYVCVPGDHKLMGAPLEPGVQVELEYALGED